MLDKIIAYGKEEKTKKMSGFVIKLHRRVNKYDIIRLYSSKGKIFANVVKIYFIKRVWDFDKFYL